MHLIANLFPFEGCVTCNSFSEFGADESKCMVMEITPCMESASVKFMLRGSIEQLKRFDFPYGFQRLHYKANILYFIRNITLQF